ncbi:MAG: hypothetical protein LBP75_03335 [Planctomycetota bacterium]|jgi:DNA segregation ATPase FtsK/SpoIIIE-like protein|nr:hypothetical protein [Planctomycetota bacterium]
MEKKVFKFIAPVVKPATNYLTVFWGMWLAGLGVFLALSFASVDLRLEPQLAAERSITGLAGAWAAYYAVLTLGYPAAFVASALIFAWGALVMRRGAFWETWTAALGGFFIVGAAAVLCGDMVDDSVFGGGLLYRVVAPYAAFYAGKSGVPLGAGLFLFVGSLLAFGNALIAGLEVVCRKIGWTLAGGIYTAARSFKRGIEAAKPVTVAASGVLPPARVAATSAAVEPNRREASASIGARVTRLRGLWQDRVAQDRSAGMNLKEEAPIVAAAKVVSGALGKIARQSRRLGAFSRFISGRKTSGQLSRQKKPDFDHASETEDFESEDPTASAFFLDDEAKNVGAESASVKVETPAPVAEIAELTPAGFAPAGLTPAGFAPAGFAPAGLVSAPVATPAPSETSVSINANFPQEWELTDESAAFIDDDAADNAADEMAAELADAAEAPNVEIPAPLIADRNDSENEIEDFDENEKIENEIANDGEDEIENEVENDGDTVASDAARFTAETAPELLDEPSGEELDGENSTDASFDDENAENMEENFGGFGGERVAEESAAEIVNEIADEAMNATAEEETPNETDDADNNNEVAAIAPAPETLTAPLPIEENFPVAPIAPKVADARETAAEVADEKILAVKVETVDELPTEQCAAPVEINAFVAEMLRRSPLLPAPVEETVEVNEEARYEDVNREEEREDARGEDASSEAEIADAAADNETDSAAATPENLSADESADESENLSEDEAEFQSANESETAEPEESDEESANAASGIPVDENETPNSAAPEESEYDENGVAENAAASAEIAAVATVKTVVVGARKLVAVQRSPVVEVLAETLPEKNALPPYELPALDLLDAPPPPLNMDVAQLERRATQLIRTLNHFKIQGNVVSVQPGPRITQFEISIAAGIPLNKIRNLADNIAMDLQALSVRIIAPIPGRDTIGIEIPNLKSELVCLRDIVDFAWRDGRRQTLPLCLAKDVAGNPIVADLAKMPHLLIAGSTGSGKSVCINSIIMSFLMCMTPEQCKLIMIDPKVVELSRFHDIPHLMSPVITDMQKAVGVLEWACQEMDERYEKLSMVSVNNLDKFNALTENEIVNRVAHRYGEEELENFPRRLPCIVIIIDELADLMMVAKKEVEHHIARLAAKSRAVGIHLILATQRPSADVITGLIKANMPSRIAFQVSSKLDSRIILDQSGADALLGQGDMLYLPPGTGKVQRAQGVYVSDEELFRVVDYCKGQRAPEYHTALEGPVIGGKPADEIDMNSLDELFFESGETIIEEQRGSVSLLQRKFGIGYGRAARIIDQLAECGVLGAFRGSGKAREITMEMVAFQEKFGEADKTVHLAGLRPDERERTAWGDE